MIPDCNETIVGIATVPGKSGIGIIRLSGKDSFAITAKFFRPKKYDTLFDQNNRTLTYGWIEDRNLTLDEVLVCTMRNPHSFTAEDVVEIQCHGGSFVMQRILAVAVKHGARLAQPGEFTHRAFINGRIDLTQAEATNDLINAKTGLGLNLAINQLKGKLYQKIAALKEDISWILSLINAEIDFPEEDVFFIHSDAIREKLQSVEVEIQELIASADIGIMIREGYKIVLAGTPNVGKSTILNGLLNQERSIVTQIPGTTRDTIEESCSIKGIPVLLTDTAGIHQTEDVVEKEGINRTYVAAQQADLIIWVIDVTNFMETVEMSEELTSLNIPILKVFNKKDCLDRNFVLSDRWKNDRYILISAIEKEGIAKLRDFIYTCISGKRDHIPEDSILTNLRQKIAATNTLSAVKQALKSIDKGLGEEYLSVDLSDALNMLGDIVGETTPDEMLHQIFANFCIGK